MDNSSSNPFSVELHNTFYFSKGPFNPSTIPVILSEVWEMLLSIGTNNRLAGKLKLVMVECLQNTFLHGLGNTQESASIEIFKLDEKIVLCVENRVGLMKIVSLKDSLDFIKSLSEKEVEEYYLKTLNNGQYSENGGAGLGLVTIAKLSKQNFHYNFQQIGIDCSSFRFQICIS